MSIAPRGDEKTCGLIFFSFSGSVNEARYIMLFLLFGKKLWPTALHSLGMEALPSRVFVDEKSP